MNRSFLNDLLASVASQGRYLVDLARGQGGGAAEGGELPEMARRLLSGRGEASGTALARAFLARYAGLPGAERRQALLALTEALSPDPAEVRRAYETWASSPDAAALANLARAAEPPRQELVRRLNRAPGGTLALVRMREDLLDALPAHPELAAFDADFTHLFGSWFNRGFLVLRRVDWTTPANVLEKVIAYEAVHAIESWDDLRSRIEPPDRRCYAFFHPALVDEPLVFVEVALTRETPGRIGDILAPGRRSLAPGEATVAVFYSISNCQRGLAGVSFGNFLIKQVVEDLQRDLPGLRTFVTLSPVPGFARWLQREADAGHPEAAAALAAGPDHPGVTALAARYLLEARGPAGRPLDPVARFHLGNGARLDAVHALADLSAKGRSASLGAMVNYLYDPAAIEANHEAFASDGTVAASPAVRRLASVVPRTPSRVA
jgi:malonyl-CoA decarboxylase